MCRSVGKGAENRIMYFAAYLPADTSSTIGSSFRDRPIYFIESEDPERYPPRSFFPAAIRRIFSTRV